MCLCLHQQLIGQCASKHISGLCRITPVSLCTEPGTLSKAKSWGCDTMQLMGRECWGSIIT